MAARSLTLATVFGDGHRELVYAFDPLSAWCYAYRPEIVAIRSAFEHLLPLRIVCGGLITGTRERPIREDEERVELEMGEVLRRSGLGFGKAFVQNLLREGSWVRRSEPGCRAVLIAQDVDPSRALDFANRLCHATFWAGLHSDQPETISSVASSAGYDSERLLALWRSSEAAERTRLAFAETRRRGVDTYPSLFLSEAEEWRLIGRGYVRAREAIPRINAALEGRGGSTGIA
jgi:putative protein-disulfide isomerase